MEKRNYARVPFHVTATVSAGRRIFSGGVSNLSINGVFVETGEHLPVDAPVRLTIALAGADPAVHVTVQGTVRRCEARGIAFAFAAVDLESFTHLRSIMEFNTADPDRVLEEITKVPAPGPAA